jgi:hypothetical protein
MVVLKFVDAFKQGLSMARSMAKDLLEVKLNELNLDEWAAIPLPITISVVPIEVNFHKTEAEISQSRIGLRSSLPPNSTLWAP